MSRTITVPPTTTVRVTEERTEIVLREHEVTWAEGAVDNEFAGRKSSKSMRSQRPNPLNTLKLTCANYFYRVLHLP